MRGELKEYLRLYEPREWLFEGQRGGRYSTRSVQNVFHGARLRAEIYEGYTVHSLRHSFATHLLEEGVNLRYIQQLLGHESSKTTEIYTHVAKQSLVEVVSPPDRLDLE